MKKATRKSDARRSQILEAAAACFREKGLKAASISDVCARLCISPGHLYYYFKSKDALIEEMFERAQQSVVVTLQALTEQADALDVLLSLDQSALRREYAAQFDMDDGMTLEFYAEATRNPRVSKIVQGYWMATAAPVSAILKEARKNGRIRSDQDLETVTSLLTMFVCALPIAQIGDPHFDPARYRASLQNMIAPFLEPVKKRRTRQST